MAASQVPTGRRGPASAWSRLKAPTIDPLEVYGLPSKGETRLNDPKAQESYYNKIVERYMKFCADAGAGDELDRQFSALALSTNNAATPSQLQPGTTNSKPSAPSKPSTGLSASKYATAAPPKPQSQDPTPSPHHATTTTTTPSPTTTTPSPELQLILSAMRKLRESITATHRTDTFAQRSYIFIVRACILTRSWESYHPALLYLLHNIHCGAGTSIGRGGKGGGGGTPLSESELREFVGYRVLDEACRIGDVAGAQRLRVAWMRRSGGATGDERVAAVLRVLVHGDWVGFWRIRRAVGGYARVLMGWAEERVRVHALKCLGRSYFSAEKIYVERCAGADWGALKTMGVGWELQEDGETVVIRRAKARLPAGSAGGSAG